MTNSVPEETLSIGDPRRAGWRDAARHPVDDDLVDVLFRLHYASLVGLGVVMLGSRDAAEDAVQDAFVALHRRLPSLREPARAEAYLRSAVLNRCRSWVRRQVTERAPRPLVPVREPQAGPENTLVGRDEVGAVVAVMRTLPRRQREVLACRYVLELTVAETATLLQVTEGTVKTHCHRGLQALQQRIEATR